MFFSFLLINYFENLYGKTLTNEYYNLKGIYQIYNLLNNKYLGIDNYNVLFLDKGPLFCIKILIFVYLKFNQIQVII